MIAVDIDKHGFFVVERIDIAEDDDGDGATIVVHGRRLDPQTGAVRENQNMTFDCASHLAVLERVQKLLTHTTWWGIA